MVITATVRPMRNGMQSLRMSTMGGAIVWTLYYMPRQQCTLIDIRQDIHATLIAKGKCTEFTKLTFLRDTKIRRGNSLLVRRPKNFPFGNRSMWEFVKIKRTN